MRFPWPKDTGYVHAVALDQTVIVQDLSFRDSDPELYRIAFAPDRLIAEFLLNHNGEP